MSWTVLLVDDDLERLGELAADLRARGLNVVIADQGEFEDRLATSRADVVLVARQLKSLTSKVQAAPCFVLTPGGQQPEAREWPRDAHEIARQVLKLRPRPAQLGRRGDFRGDLAQVNLVDLLQLLSANKRTGLLSIKTPAGSGELRLDQGEIADAAYQRLDGRKAIFRLLGVSEGSFAFVSGGATGQRRIQLSTQELLMDGLRQLDEAQVRLARLKPDSDAFIAQGELPEDATSLERQVLERLSAPLTLTELLDDLVDADAEILAQVELLLAAGRVRRVPHGAERVTVADEENREIFSAILARLSREGLGGQCRIAIAARQADLLATSHALGRLEELRPAEQAPPTAPIPYTLGRLKLDEGEGLELIALPLVEAFIALWPLSLAGSAAVIAVGGALDGPYRHAIAEQEIPIVESGPELDPADPGQIAALLRRALDAVSSRK